MELKHYVGATKASSSVILFSLMHVIAHLCFWIVSILLAATVTLKEGWTGVLIVSFIGCVILLVLFFRGHKKGLVSGVLRLGRKLPFFGKRINAYMTKEHNRIELIDKQIASLHGSYKAKFYLALAIEFSARILSAAEIFFIFLALGYSVSYLHCVLIVAFTTLFTNILFFSPMQIGTREGGFLLVFEILGLSSVLAVSISFITRIRELFWVLIGLLLVKITLKDGSIKLTPEELQTETERLASEVNA
jgi:uncharacterized membrane protein YbhN (UPF0104 family)